MPSSIHSPGNFLNSSQRCSNIGIFIMTKEENSKGFKIVTDQAGLQFSIG